MTGPDAGRTVRHVEQVMGLPVSLALRGRHADDDAGAQAWRSALAVLREVDAVFSTYRADSAVSRLGREEITLRDCPPEVAEVLDLGEQARHQSQGAFDVRRPGPDGRLVLDPSGAVKGWAVERALRAFDGLAETDVCLSAGGDLACRTRTPSPGWRIGVEDPRSPDRVVAVLTLRDGAVATSGSAHRGHHVVDARTGVAPRGTASVTVVGPDLTWADIDATAAYALGAAGPAWLQARGRTAVVVGDDGSVERLSPGVRRVRRP